MFICHSRPVFQELKVPLQTGNSFVQFNRLFGPDRFVTRWSRVRLGSLHRLRNSVDKNIFGFIKESNIVKSSTRIVPQTPVKDIKGDFDTIVRFKYERKRETIVHVGFGGYEPCYSDRKHRPRRKQSSLRREVRKRFNRDLEISMDLTENNLFRTISTLYFH